MTRTVTADQLLDLDGVRVRAESVRFDVCDADLTVLFTLHPDKSQPATVDLSTEGAVKRTLSGLRIAPDEAADLDVFTHRIRPYWVLETGDEYPLGVFLLQEAHEEIATSGDWFVAGNLFDQSLILEEGRRSTFSLSSGSGITDAIAAVTAEVGVTRTRITESSETTQGEVAWPQGTPRAQTVTDLCRMVGYFDPYFDNDGYLVCRPSVDPSTATAEHRYGTGVDPSRVIATTARRTTDAYKVPNVVVVTSTNALGQPVTGTYEAPASAPYSEANRGYEVVKQVDEPGIPDTSTAEARARAVAEQESPHEIVEFDGTPDPRHDTHNIVEFDGVNFLEKGWSLTLAPGGPHRHRLSKIYVP